MQSFHKFEYFLVLIISGILPFVIGIFHPLSPLKGKLKTAIWTILICSIPYLIWDVFATARGHWSFNQNFITGIYIYNLPIEEVLFFFVIPYSCLFTYGVLKLALNHFRPAK